MSAFQKHHDELEKHETMMGQARGRLAVALDLLTDALAMVGQHGVYCQSARTPGRPAMDIAMVIEQISGASFEEFVREEILLPAGVDRIGYVLAGWKNEQLAVCYDRGGKRWGTPLDHAWLEDGPSWNLRGNGGMLATAEQLGRWYEALLDGKVLGPAALNIVDSFNNSL